MIALGVRINLNQKRIQKAELAQLLGCSESYVSARINGYVPFNTEELAIIADEFDIPLIQLILPRNEHEIASEVALDDQNHVLA
jgi:transcriptional regulator with XRE-family HTH domain